MTTLDREETLELLGGDLQNVRAEMRAFEEAARALDARWHELVRDHPNKWIGVHGDVEVIASSHGEVMARLEAMGRPAREALIRFIDSGERILILVQC